MGFRSTLTIEHYAITWPDWFVEKYSNSVWFGEGNKGVIASKYEAKTYGMFSDLHNDIQKAINWDNAPESIVLVYLHECGGVTRCQIFKDKIKWSEPESWRETDGVEHNYCYGCSDANGLNKRTAPMKVTASAPPRFSPSA